MQKLINVMALTSFAVSGVVVAGGVYVYINKDSIVENVKSQVMKAATGGIEMPSMPSMPSGGAPSSSPVSIPVMPF